MIAPPLNSKIRVEYVQGDQIIFIPQPQGGFFRFFIGAFMLFWIAAWALGWVYGVEAMVTGSNGNRAFLLFWLGAWTTGGLFAIYYLYRIFQAAVPEKIILSSPDLTYDSGIAPLRISYTFGSQRDVWKRLFQKRIRTTFDLSQIGTLKLRDVESGNRLTIDQGARRFDLAVSATEPEREWLYSVLKAHYNR